jgi:putative membrane-bound dehydrogenase-like protein
MFSVAALAQDRALPPEEAAATMKLPPGFKCTVFAAEPAITQPIAFTFDDRGRIWVIENFSYPSWRSDNTGHDRVTILEDTDGDGRHDKRTVFLDNGANLSGIEVGFGGVWLVSTPNFIFIPDADGDDKPDGPAKVLLDGFTLECKHNVTGNLAWGPDGWLYGCHGITAPSLVGKPGTPPEKRQVVHCGVWRYHPVRHEWEVYANGTTNPWGLDWDERGELFITNCVIKHIFHVIPGGHYVRMFGQDPNPYVYGLMESCADHQHWAGGHWTTARGGEKHHDFGGGHAHSGCMIYLGDNWPAEYRGNAFMLNIHGQRLNRDTLEPHGSSYIAHHGPDMGFSQDPWFRGLHCKYGPDGGVYISDWSDIGECHDRNEMEIDRTSGRIFKIVYEPNTLARSASEGDADSTPKSSSAVGNALGRVPGLDFSKLSDQVLASHLGGNEWIARHSRRLLQERAAEGRLDKTVLENPKAWLTHIPQFNERFSGSVFSTELPALRLLHVTGQLDEKILLKAVMTPLDELRAQAITLAAERRPSALMLEKLAWLGKNDPTRTGRMHLASALQRIPLDDRWPIAEALLAHGEDASDPYLPLMYWYGFEPLVSHNVRKSIELLPKIQIPIVRQYIARRLVAVREAENIQARSASEGPRSGPSSTAWILDELLKALAASSDPIRLDILAGLKEAYRGRRTVTQPVTWHDVYLELAKTENREVREDAKEIGVVFGDRSLIAELEESLNKNPTTDIAARRRAIELLTAKREPQFLQTLFKLLQDADLRADAIRSLAAYDDAEIPPRLVALYPKLNAAERQDAIQTLTARPAFAATLLDGIDEGFIPRRDVSALTIRQLQQMNDERVSRRLTSVWGTFRRASADKAAKAEQLKSQLTADVLKSADLAHGREVFIKNCASCHILFGEGSKIGPELTGSQRTNLDYVLDNVLDPSAIVPREYQVQILRLDDGRVVQGVIAEENPQTVTVQTANERLSIPVADIEARKNSPLSMMPEGLLDRLTPDEVRDLVAYLGSPQQAPLAR